MANALADMQLCLPCVNAIKSTDKAIDIVGFKSRPLFQLRLEDPGRAFGGTALVIKRKVDQSGKKIRPFAMPAGHFRKNLRIPAVIRPQFPKKLFASQSISSLNRHLPDARGPGLPYPRSNGRCFRQ